MKNQITVEDMQMNEVVVKLGRPVNPNSARQQRIAELAAKKERGEGKRGRPIIANSARQQRLAERNEKLAKGIELKRGRPIDVNSKRQQDLAAKAAKSVENAVASIIG